MHAMTKLINRFALVLLIFVPLSVAGAQSANPGEDVYIRFMHAAPSAPPVYALINDEVHQQAITISWGALWTSRSMLTTPLTLPVRDQRTHVLPVGGISDYDYNRYFAGRYTVAFFLAPQYSSEPDEREIVASLEIDLTPGYHLFILVEDADGALTIHPLSETRPTEDESVYTLINGIPDAETQIQLMVNGEPVAQPLGNGEAVTNVYDAPSTGRVQVAVVGDEDTPLYDESAPGRALLPRTHYKLVTVRMGDAIGVLTVADGRGTGRSVSQSDGFSIGEPVISQVEPENQESSHHFFVDDGEQVRIIVEPTEASELDAYLRIVRVMDGALMAFTNELPAVDGTRRLTFDLPELPGGSYMVAVTPYAFVTRGEYRIVLERLGE